MPLVYGKALGEQLARGTNVLSIHMRDCAVYECLK